MTDSSRQIVAGSASGASGAALIAKYRTALGSPSNLDRWGISGYSTLIPQADLPDLIAAIEWRLRPASQRDIGGAVTLIAAAWPYAHQKVDGGALELFLQQLAEDLAEFPADILHEAVRQVRRTLKFAPSIAEIYQAAEALMSERRCKLEVARGHLAEHERRQAARDAEVAARVEHERHLRVELDKLVAAYGDAAAAYTFSDLGHALDGVTRGGLKLSARWRDALRASERWALDVLPVAALMGEAWPRYMARNVVAASSISTARLCIALRTARTDFAEARRLITDTEPLDAEDDDAVTWPHPTRLFAEIVAEIERECTTAVA